MKRMVAAVAVLLLVIAGAAPIQASTPAINVAASGVELCPQSICGAAIFAGLVHGQVGANPNAFGTFAVAITHDPLPEPGDTAALTGGVFEFRVGLRRIRGVVLAGTLLNNGTIPGGENTFTVHAVLAITSGGHGLLVFDGLLNHNVFPPTIVGTVTEL
jgi:hypothetical protein